MAGFGGFALSLDWRMFLFLLAVGCIMALVFNYGCSISFSASFLLVDVLGMKLVQGVGASWHMAMDFDSILS